MMTKRTALFMVALTACRPDAGVDVTAEFATPPGSAEPNLTVTGSGDVLLSWHERVDDDTYALRFAVREAGGWSQPVTIVERDQFFVNWADFPSLTELADGSWMVHWLEKSAPGTYAYHVKLAISHDRGRTWSEPFTPHRDMSPTEHGFVSMVPWGADGGALVWLDGRAMQVDAGEDVDELDPGAMSIRATTVSSSGALGDDVLLDDRTCECCQTSLARTSHGLVAAYRDRSEAEIRNISVTRMMNGAWTDPVYVHDDGWMYPGCPVNGPQLSARQDTVLVAWYTAPDGRGTVYAAFSTDAGASFNEPIRLDDGDPIGRVDVEFFEEGTGFVTWIERTGDSAAVRGQTIRADGTTSRAITVAAISESRASGFPRLAVVGDEVLVAWTEFGEPSRVRVVSLQQSRLR